MSVYCPGIPSVLNTLLYIVGVLLNRKVFPLNLGLLCCIKTSVKACHTICFSAADGIFAGFSGWMESSIAGTIHLVDLAVFSWVLRRRSFGIIACKKLEFIF